MNRLIIKHPKPEDVAKWGILAHVEEAERNRILFLPHGQTKKAIKALEREVDLVKFPRKKKSIVSESWYNSNKPKPHKEPSHDERPEPDDE